MKPRFYVHMGPKTAENVSCMWKAAHISIFFLILCSSSVASACIYNILDMYNFNCILYARVSLEYTFEERFKTESEIEPSNATAEVTTVGEQTDELSTSQRKKRDAMRLFGVSPDCSKDPAAAGCHQTTVLVPLQRKHQLLFRKGLLKNVKMAHRRDRMYARSFTNGSSEQHAGVNNTGFLNMRKTAFATIYMCDLMLFAPLASFITAIFLGALIGVAGKGGAGNPGDVLPNPWICVYPFLGFCVFMMIFSFIADNLYHKGLAAFCLKYFHLTKSKLCSPHMDHFNVQFSRDQEGPPRAFYTNYLIGSYGVQLTSAFWAVQSLIYVFRIICLADFSLYLTRIKLKDDDKGQDPKIANIVMNLMDSKSKMV